MTTMLHDDAADHLPVFQVTLFNTRAFKKVRQFHFHINVQVLIVQPRLIFDVFYMWQVLAGRMSTH